MQNGELIPSKILVDEPIDFEGLRKATLEFGPLILSQRGTPYTVEIEISPCMCSNEGCEEQLVLIWRRNGVFTIHWILSKAEFLKYESLVDFKNSALKGFLRDSRGERMIIEHSAKDAFRSDSEHIDPFTCACEECSEATGEEVIAKKLLLSQLMNALQQRQALIDEANKSGNKGISDLAAWIFDLGYSAGRIYSELKVKEYIEADALAGRAFEELKERRAREAGKKSSSKRSERIHMLLENMESLAAENPAVTRFGPSQLARLAFEDAAQTNPNLWSQGSGQIEEYVGELRRGEAGQVLQQRYFTMFPSPLVRQK
jgi:hypothetical protein